MKKSILFLSLFCLLNISFAEKLHLFVIVDFEDTNIGGRHDHAKIHRLGQDIATATGMSLKTYDFKQSEMTTSRLKTELNQMNCSPDDVIWFYYFGHGTNCDGTWPMFTVNDGVVCEKDVHNKVLTKNARLAITMFDCCNTGNGIRHDGGSRLTALATVYTTLFKKTKGDIMVCGTRQGTYGWASPTEGSHFTNSFVTALGNQTRANITWEQILQTTKSDVERQAENICRSNPSRCENQWKQSPHFVVNVTTEQIEAGEENRNAPDETLPSQTIDFSPSTNQTTPTKVVEF